MWRIPESTQRQARKMTSGPSPAVKTRVLYFNTTQSRFVSGLLTGHNTLRRHLHLMGLIGSPLCRRCRAEEENSIHVLCECAALASFRRAYLGPFFLDPEYVQSQSLVAIWNFRKGTGFASLDIRLWGSRVRLKALVHRDGKCSNQIITHYCQTLPHS